MHQLWGGVSRSLSSSDHSQDSERRKTRREMSANEDEGQIAVLHKLVRGWRRLGSVERTGKSARGRGGRGEVVGAPEGDKVTPPVHKHVTCLPRVDVCTGRKHKGALQLIKSIIPAGMFSAVAPTLSTDHLPLSLSLPRCCLSPHINPTFYLCTPTTPALFFALHG